MRWASCTKWAKGFPLTERKLSNTTRRLPKLATSRCPQHHRIESLSDWATCQGLFHLGACYSAGIGIKKDQRKAVHYWGKAAESGEAPFCVTALHTDNIYAQAMPQRRSIWECGSNKAILYLRHQTECSEWQPSELTAVAGQEESTWPFRKGSQQGPPGCNVSRLQPLSGAD